MIPFERAADGMITVGFTSPESELISSLASQIAGMLGGLATAPGAHDDGTADPLFDVAGIGGSSAPPTDPALARLLPDAYREDDEAARDFRRLTERSLASRKVANALVVIDSLDAAGDDGAEIRLDAAATQSWLRGLADIRLTIATRIGIETDDDELAIERDADDETLVMLDVYDWLGGVTDSLVRALDD